MKIFIPYRPSNGGLNSISENPIQNEDYSFNDSSRRHPDEDIHRCLRSIAKNSRYRHEAVVCIDEDMTIREDWLKHLKLQDKLDITIYRCKNREMTDPHHRLPESLKQAIITLSSDSELIAYDLIADTVVAKNWDVQIIDSFKQYGNQYYYASMFVEARTDTSRSQIVSLTPEVLDEIRRCAPTTTNNIWNLWRNTICCHSLTFVPKSDRNYSVEEDFDEYIAISNQFDRETIIEDAGERKYGYWAPIMSTGGVFKNLFPKILSISGSDLCLDNSFPMKKMVLCRSYVFHMHHKTILDDKEVERVN